MVKFRLEQCKKCQKRYRFITTGCDLCPKCVKKWSYFVSFIEEAFVGVNDKVFGRIEVYSNIKPEEYAYRGNTIFISG